LNPTVRQKFWEYPIVVRDLGPSSDGELRDIFLRLNKHSVKLNDQELRNARYKGVFIQLMEELADDNWWIDSRIVNTRQVRRMEDIEFVSELFVGLLSGPQNKKETLDDFYKAYEKEFPEKDKFSKLFRDTKALVADVLGTEDIKDWSGKSDFYGLFLAFGDYTEYTVTSQKKKALKAELAKFRSAVDVAKKRDAKPAKDRRVARYVDTIKGAASDIDRRAFRIKVLKAIVDKELT
jgi:hypothetical protein